MSVEQTVLDRLKELPSGKQKEVLDFIDFLQHKSKKKPSSESLDGFWSGFKIDIADKDISEIRKEMWSDFPRGDI